MRFEMYFEIYKENDLNKTFFCQEREKFPHSDRKYFVSPRSEQKNQAHINLLLKLHKIKFHLAKFDHQLRTLDWSKLALR